MNQEFQCAVEAYIAHFFNPPRLSGIKVKQSILPIPDCGGLFADRAIAKGTLICRYTGRVLTTKEAIKLPSELKGYLMRLGEQCYVDARECPQYIGRYINDCRNPLGWNVEFQKKPQEQCAYVVALRDIVEGEELFVDYGKWYWALLKPIKLPTSEVRRNMQLPPLDHKKYGLF